ncbi:MAG: sulfotransferase [Alphaproteobacteria bacterium]
MASVSFFTDFLGGLLDKHPAFLKRLGTLETRALKYDIINTEIKAPVFICGLARSGSTILLEILNSHKDFTSFQYRDYPFVHCPAFWDFANKFVPRSTKKIERAHKDRIMIDWTSPEALDEIIWMSFFDDLHNPSINNVLGPQDKNPDFDAFFSHSIRKLLALRKAKRYVSKNNANSARLEYIQNLYPDARFIVPIRKPAEHVYSLLKQHKLLLEAQKDDPRGQRYMRRHGHFEFGSDFRPLNFHDTHATERILDLWRAGDCVSAYARYWDKTYAHIYNTVQSNEDLKKNTLFIRYDELCASPSDHLEKLSDFCAIKEDKEQLINSWKDKISAPDYYKITLSDEEQSRIKEITHGTAAKFWKTGHKAEN